MNSKTINTVLIKKFNDWVKSIDDLDIKKLILENTIITGGSLVSLLQNEKPKDYDLYFRTAETAFEVTKYYIKKFEKNKNIHILYNNKKYILIDNEFVIDDSESITMSDPTRIQIFIPSDGVKSVSNEITSDVDTEIEELINEDNNDNEYINNNTDEKYQPIFISSNAITLSNNIQLVIRFYGEPEEIHSNYDFVHCTNYWTSWENKVILNKEALESIINKQLYYIGSKYPICSVIRTRKFIKRGWHINAGQYVKMAFQISKLDLTDISVLEDQLVGVDSTYFEILINALKSKKNTDSEFQINENYIIALIDKIF